MSKEFFLLSRENRLVFMVESDPFPEIVREYGGMESAGMSAGFSSYPTMSSRYGDFARDQQQQQQQSSAAHSQRRKICMRFRLD